MKLLLIEDDSGIAGYIGAGLAEAGHGVDRAADGLSGMELACTCLLYTSPSPRDLSTSRMPSSA